MDLGDIGRLALALALGAVIGFERRWHGHAAGPHTNALVAFGAALFLLIGTTTGTDAVSRIAAQVATGVGFLGAGVIMRAGFKVRGLNTAATIWCVAGVGSLVGLRYIGVAIAAAGLLLAANLCFHLIEHRLPSLVDPHYDGTSRRQRETSQP